MTEIRRLPPSFTSPTFTQGRARPTWGAGARITIGAPRLSSRGAVSLSGVLPRKVAVQESVRSSRLYQ